MKVEILDAASVERKLRALISSHAKIEIAVAWGSKVDLADILLANRQKFESVIVGINLFNTSPDLIDALVGVPKTYIARPKKGIFHPKIYFFEGNENCEAIIGSSNFTSGGLDKNFEASLYIKGKTQDAIFKEIKSQLNNYKSLRQEVTREIAQSYRQQYEALAKGRKKIDPILPKDGSDWNRINSRLVKLKWPDYLKAVRMDRYHDFEKRLHLIEKIQSMFAEIQSFSDLSTSKWKAISGAIGEAEKKDSDLQEFDWGWFGTTRALGSFTNLLNKRDQHIASAIDQIPRQGLVMEGDFVRFCSHFSRAFQSSARSGGVAIASRLLSMKRPDTFVCINGANRYGLADALSFSPTTLNITNYWQRVVEPIRCSVWYSVPRPSGKIAGQVWEYRAAMLDAIYYDPED